LSNFDGTNKKKQDPRIASCSRLISIILAVLELHLKEPSFPKTGSIGDLARG
jgi:hypothetical protein